MEDKEHFIYLLQSCYFGDRTAFNELAMIYKKQRETIKEVREYIEKQKQDSDNWIDYELLIQPSILEDILRGDKK